MLWLECKWICIRMKGIGQTYRKNKTTSTRKKKEKDLSKKICVESPKRPEREGSEGIERETNTRLQWNKYRDLVVNDKHLQRGFQVLPVRVSTRSWSRRFLVIRSTTYVLPNEGKDTHRLLWRPGRRGKGEIIQSFSLFLIPFSVTFFVEFSYTPKILLS